MAFALGGSIGFVILAEKLVDVDDFQFYTYLVAIAFLALYGGLIYLYKSGKRRTGTVLLAALALVSVEAAVNMTVTNTYLEELNLKITKKGKNTTEGEGRLSGVEFKLEKKNGEYYESFLDPQKTVDGIATFTKLGQGTYRLIETKAAAGYNLLSDSILIEIDASNQVKWKMEKETSWKDISLEEEKVIPLTIYNTKQLILPATGGSGFGLVTMGGIALMAQAILMGTYFTMQCRKGDDKLRKKR